MSSINVGFTGTSHHDGMNDFQHDSVERLLKWLHPKKVHHGDCVGADYHFDVITKRLGIYRVLHPPTDDKKRAFCKTEEERVPYPYLVRNKHIVNETKVLIATPKETEEVLRSGTWSTIRYARKLNRAIALVLPNEVRFEGDIQP